MIDVNTPKPISTGEPITALESAWLAISNPTSKSVHLEPRQAEALWIEHDKLTKQVERLTRELAISEGDYERLDTAYSTLFNQHKNCNAYVVFTDSQTVSREVD